MHVGVGVYIIDFPPIQQQPGSLDPKKQQLGDTKLTEAKQNVRENSEGSQGDIAGASEEPLDPPQVHCTCTCMYM